MRRVIKVLAIILAVIFCIIAAAMCVLRYYVIPRYASQVLQKAEVVLNDEEVRANIDQFVQELRDEGVLEDEKISTYLQYTDYRNGNQKEPALQQDVQQFAPTVQGEVDEAEPQLPKSDTQRVMEAMTADELNFAMSLTKKIDISTMTGLLKQDRQQAKKYIKEHLSADEISKALEIYSKYSYLLQ